MVLVGAGGPWGCGKVIGDSGGCAPPSPAAPAGRMYLFYGNKTSVQFQSFTPTVTYPGELQSHILSWGQGGLWGQGHGEVCGCGLQGWGLGDK